MNNKKLLLKMCECGCGEKVSKPGNKFICGHNRNRKGVYLSEEARKKMSVSQLSRWKNDHNNREKLVQRMSGKNHPMYGRKGKLNPRYGQHHTDEAKREIGNANKGERHGMYGKHHTEEARKRIGEAQKGEKNSNYGQHPPKGTGRGKGSYCLKGHWVRSTWERAVTDFLFKNNVEYEYESKRFLIGSKRSYRPDFYLPQYDLYIEVKGYMCSKSKLQLEWFKKQGYNLLIIDSEIYPNFEEVIWTTINF